MMTAYGDTVTILRAVLVPGPYNSKVYDWANATRTSTPAAVQPLSSSEDVVRQQRTETRWRVFLPAAVDVLATDRLEWDTAALEVDGDVEVHKRRGVRHHVELVARRITQA